MSSLGRDSGPSGTHLEECCVLRSLGDACWGLQSACFPGEMWVGSCPEKCRDQDRKRVKVALLELDSAAPAVASGSHFQNITYAGDGGGGEM